MKEFDLKDTKDSSNMFKEVMSDTIQEMLNGEFDDELGYDKYEQSKKKTNTFRNGISEKSMRSEFGDVNINIPRERNSNFEPQIVKKYQKNLGTIEQQILTLYAKGMSNRKIEDFKQHLFEVLSASQKAG